MKEPQQFKHLKKKMKKTQMMEGKSPYLYANFLTYSKAISYSKRYHMQISFLTLQNSNNGVLVSRIKFE